MTMAKRKNKDSDYDDLPVLDMAHVRETIELHRELQEAVRLQRQKRWERHHRLR